MKSRATELEKLMDAGTSEEKACQKFLDDIAVLLVPVPVPEESILVKGREESSRPGDSDFCVSVEVDNGAMGRRFAYVWEVKAPQKYLFQRDSATNRLRPTDDLYSAENQLINYVAELDTSKNFREKYQLTGANDEVRVGGIIIGRKKTIVKGLNEDSGLEGLARNAFTTRDAFIWGPAKFQVLTWDWVLEKLKRVEQGTSVPFATVASTSPNSQGLLAFANRMMSSPDQLAFRAAVTYAYAAVEVKIMPGGWAGRRPSPRDVVAKVVALTRRHGIGMLFRNLANCRNRSVHMYGEPVTEEDAIRSVRDAEKFCREWDELLKEFGLDGIADSL